MITALFIGALGLRIRERDSVVGVVMAFGLGLGVLFITLYSRYASEAFAILFGAITAVSRADLMHLSAVAAITIVGLGIMYRPLTFATVDPIVAEARGVPVRLISILFLLMLAAAGAEAVQVVGVLLILILTVYLAKTGAGGKRADIDRIQKQITDEQTQVRMLRAEVAIRCVPRGSV